MISPLPYWGSKHGLEYILGGYGLGYQYQADFLNSSALKKYRNDSLQISK
jgi:hypothetical protein